MADEGTDDFKRGLKEGRTDALLEEHSKHFQRINGSIDKFIKVAEDNATAMRELASEIRTLQEEGRLAEERVKVAATTLATETERRREELAVATSTTASADAKGARRWSKWDRILASAIALATLVTLIVGAHYAHIR